MDLENKKVVITGASKGIGQATAIEFSKYNVELVLTYRTDKKGMKKTVESCKKNQVKVNSYKLDVSKESSIKNFRKKVKNIDILVNNAGVIAWKEFDKHKKSEIDSQIDTNLKGLIKMVHEFQDDIEKNKGMIINVSSGAGKDAYPELSVYCATKFGVRGFTQSLNKELTRGQVISVNPARTKTQMTGFKGMPPKKVAEVIVKTALGKIKPDKKRDVDVWKFV